MTTKTSQSELEETVLTSSRRRCAMCFGLKRDTTMKRGQIAHLDGNHSNNVFENLCFLCLDHHEEYDSRSRQAKGFKPEEVKKYRSELYESIKTEWSQPASFIDPNNIAKSNFDGHYIYESANEVSEFDVKTLPNGNIQVQGFALWGTQSAAPHSGSVDFNTSIRDNRAYFSDRYDNNWYNLELNFTGDGIDVNEQKNTGYHGLNVNFQGKYRRV